MKTETIIQNETFTCTSKDFYSAILNAKKHSEFTKSECIISDHENADYSVYDGYIVGKNLKLEPFNRIEQTWKAVEADWPEHHFSNITFEIKAFNEKIEVKFTHSGIPKGLEQKYDEGWKEHYWQKMRTAFNW